MSNQVNEFRIFGPPGTGKTTELARQVARAAEKHGSEGIFVSSFTRTAAAELNARKLPLDKDQVGTLHAHCYRAIGGVQLAESNFKSWNERYPEYMIGDAPVDPDDPYAERRYRESKGDELLQRLQHFRARMADQKFWPMSVRNFYKHWTNWKVESGYHDFTDLLEFALKFIDRAPRNPTIGFFDEVQDWAKLELSLVRKWGAHMEFFVLAGDDDQCIYSFKGATPDAFLNPPIAEENKRFLSQSYRLPRAVYDYAEKWVKKLSHRQPKDYKPRDADGEVEKWLYKGGATFEKPDRIIEDVAAQVDAGKTCMILGTCSYMLRNTVQALKEKGIAFHNPYRRKRGDWNPLHPGGRGVTVPQRLKAMLRPYSKEQGGEDSLWTGDDLKKWIPLVSSKSGVLVRGAKTRVREFYDGQEVNFEEVATLFKPEAFQELLYGDDGPLNWLGRHALESRSNALGYLYKIIDRSGIEALDKQPLVTLGTVHSVKGGQADVVYMYPDLSPSAAGEWERGPEQRDAVRRVFYVGFTRARERLVLCSAVSPRAVRFP